MEDFSKINSTNSFDCVFNETDLIDVPEDWLVIITDVKGSTKAIEAGKYKEVNTAGGFAVIAVTNLIQDMQFPFVFGGDGVTMLIPEKYLDKVSDVLVDTKNKVLDYFSLDLRVGIVPMKDLLEKNYTLRIGKLDVSQYYSQAILYGEGFDIAENWVKAPDGKYLVSVKKDETVEANFSGFTCRWRNIASVHDEMISLIVKVRGDNLKQQSKLYLEILDQIENLIGDESHYHPVKPKKLKSAPLKYFRNEAMASSNKTNFFGYLPQLSNILIQQLITTITRAFNLNIKAHYFDLKNIKNYNVISSDYRKFDGTLKMVLSTTTKKRKLFIEYLEKLHDQQKIFYGHKISKDALMTCILHSDSEREVHFIDGADGGYALAAKILKQQIKDSKDQSL